ncbi:alpha/beta hydrolase [candidate division KSB1 bacterium]|nr:alpha/beta hydrolase [candidate division KSB1 bacterium]
MKQDEPVYLIFPNTTEQIEFVPINSNVTLLLRTFRPKIPTSNPPVLFVAGWISQIESWQYVLSDMCKDFVIYYLETREKKSSRVKGNVEYGVEDLAKDLTVLVQHLHLEAGNYILFGSSLGASAILEANHLLSAIPCCQLLVGPNAVFRVPFLGKLMVWLTHPALYIVVKEIVKWYLRTFRMKLDKDVAQYKKYANALDAADPWKLKKAMLKLSKYEIWERLPTIQTPTLIVGGKSDTLHEPDNLQKIVSQMPNAKYVDMETNSNTHSSLVVDNLRQFLKDLNH